MRGPEPSKRKLGAWCPHKCLERGWIRAHFWRAPPSGAEGLAREMRFSPSELQGSARPTPGAAGVSGPEPCVSSLWSPRVLTAVWLVGTEPPLGPHLPPRPCAGGRGQRGMWAQFRKRIKTKCRQSHCPPVSWERASRRRPKQGPPAKRTSARPLRGPGAGGRVKACGPHGHVVALASACGQRGLSRTSSLTLTWPALRLWLTLPTPPFPRAPRPAPATLPSLSALLGTVAGSLHMAPQLGVQGSSPGGPWSPEPI